MHKIRPMGRNEHCQWPTLSVTMIRHHGLYCMPSLWPLEVNIITWCYFTCDDTKVWKGYINCPWRHTNKKQWGRVLDLNCLVLDPFLLITMLQPFSNQNPSLTRNKMAQEVWALDNKSRIHPVKVPMAQNNVQRSQHVLGSKPISSHAGSFSHSWTQTCPSVTSRHKKYTII